MTNRKLEFVPLALTSVDSKRKFAMAMKFTENIKYYLCALKKQMENLYDVEYQEKLDSSENNAK